MSAVLNYFRQKDSRFNAVPDDELISYIGQRRPEFLQDQEFNTEFQRVKPPPSLQPEFAKAFAPSQPELTQEDKLRIKAQEDEQFRQTFEATVDLVGDDPGKRAALQAAHRQVMRERGVTVLDEPELASATKPLVDIPRVTGEEVAQATGLPQTAADVTAGLQQAAAGLTEFFLTPLGISTLGLGALPGVVQRNVSAMFAADMASTMPQQASELYEAFKAKDVERTTAALVGLGMTPVFIKGALKHATTEFAEAQARAEVMLGAARETALLLADPKISGLPATPKEMIKVAFDRGVRVVDSVPEVPVDWTVDLWTPGSPRAVKQDVANGKLGWDQGVDERLGRRLYARDVRYAQERMELPGKTKEVVEETTVPRTPPIVQEVPESVKAIETLIKEQAATVAATETTPDLPTALKTLEFSPEWQQTVGETRLFGDVPKLSNEQLMSLYASTMPRSPVDFGKAFALEAKRLGVELTPEQVSQPSKFKHGAQNYSALLHTTVYTELYKRGLTRQAEEFAKNNPVPLEQVMQRLTEWPPTIVQPSAPSTASPSSQALGIVPPGSRIAMAVADKFQRYFRKNVSVEEELPFAFSDATPLPRFQSYEMLRGTVTKPFGIGKVGVLGRLFDPRYRSGDPVLGAVIINAYSKEMGNNVAKIVGAELAFADKEFKGLPISDYVEAYLRDPESVVASDVQKAAIAKAKTYIDDALGMMAEAGISKAEALKLFVEGAEDGAIGYFPRTWLGKVDLPGKQGEARGMGLGTKPGALKERKFATEEEGRAAGHIYEENFSARVANYVQKAYHAVANKRFVEDPRLGGERVQDRMEQLAESNFEELAILKAAVGRAENKAEAARRYEEYVDLYDELARDFPDVFQNFKDQVQPTAAEGQTVHPALRGMIFDKATLEKLNDWLIPTKHKYVDMISKVNAASKGAQLALDNSAPLVQGLPLLFAYPDVWAKAMAANLRAWRRPNYLEHELTKPEIREAAMQLAQLGVSFRVLNDYMAGVQKGSYLESLPGLGSLFNRAGGAFGAFVDMAKVNLWMAVRENIPQREWFRAAEAIDNIMGSARGKNIGKSVARMEVSQNLMLAPSYYMSGLNLVAGLTAKGAGGELIRRVTGRFAAGMLFTTFAGWLAAGLSWDEMEERAKRMDFTVPVEIWKDRTVNVGFTHILLSLAKASAATFKAAVDKRTPLASSRWRENALLQGDPAQNPILRWFWGHSAPVASLAVELVKDYDFLGQDVNIPQSLLRRIQPLWFAQVFQSLENSKSGALPVIGDALASGMGLNAYPQNYQQLYKNKANEESQKQFGRDYDQLSVQEQLRVAKVIHKLPDIANKPPASKIAKEQATKWESLRRQRMTEGLTREAAAPLEKHGLHLTTFDAKLSLGGESLWLTGDQQDQLEAMIVGEYNRMLPRIATKLDKVPVFKRQEFLNGVLGDAKTRAKAAFVKASAARGRAQGAR